MHGYATGRQFGQILGILAHRQGKVRGCGRLDTVFQDRLKILGQVVHEVPVEDEFKGFRGLVIGREIVVLGHVLRTEAAV